MQQKISRTYHRFENEKQRKTAIEKLPYWLKWYNVYPNLSFDKALQNFSRDKNISVKRAGYSKRMKRFIIEFERK